MSTPDNETYVVLRARISEALANQGHVDDRAQERRFAELCGVTQRTARRWLAGGMWASCKFTECVPRLADGLGVRPAWLFGDPVKSTPELAFARSIEALPAEKQRKLYRLVSLLADHDTRAEQWLDEFKAGQLSAEDLLQML